MAKAQGVNKAILIGNLGKDPESRQVGSSTTCQFSLATNAVWKDKEGELQEKVSWHNIVTWGKLAEICDKYLKKGRQVYVEGRIEYRQYEDKQGNTRYITEIIANEVQFLGPKEGGERRDSGPSGQPGGYGDDIPF